MLFTTMLASIPLKKIVLFSLNTLFFLSFFSSTSAQESSEFQLGGTSKLLLKNESGDSIHILTDNWIYLPLQNEQIDTLMLPKQSMELIVTTQAKHYYELEINEIEFRLFAEPGVQNEITILNNEQIQFSGKHKSIHEFLAKRKFYSRRYWYQGGGSLPDLITAYDSITDLEKRELHVNTNLPSWYREFENSRLDYVNAEYKLNALAYRKKMLLINDSVPADYLSQVTTELLIERVDFAGNVNYMRFIRWYISYKTDPFQQRGIPNSKKEWIASAVSRLESVEQNISNQSIKEIFLSRIFTDMIDRTRHIWNEAWLEHINNQELLDLINQQVVARPFLPKGNNLPFFYLYDEDSISHEPKDFRGKILLINFWATWCKPCYKEFEHENRLVERFKGQPVEIVNICIESKKHKWAEVVNKYQLKTKNLYAGKIWSEKINRDFGTSALPQSILIDWNGKVIQNKCPGPSAGIEELITDALVELKEGNKH